MCTPQLIIPLLYLAMLCSKVSEFICGLLFFVDGPCKRKQSKIGLLEGKKKKGSASWKNIPPFNVNCCLSYRAGRRYSIYGSLCRLARKTSRTRVANQKRIQEKESLFLFTLGWSDASTRMGLNEKNKTAEC